MEPVTTSQFEAALAALEARVDDPIAGLFGPGSEVWTKQGETMVFAAAGRAALLQLAHPAVAQAVEEFSITREDPVTRFRNTFFYVFAMVFGDLRTATRMARTVHRVHQRVRGAIQDDDAGPVFPRGTPYHANDPEAQLWVASTLVESSAWVYETLVRPLTHVERKRWVAELPRFTALFGIPESLLFSTWGAFEDYNRRMWVSDTLTVSSTARSLMRALTTPPTIALAPLWRIYVNFTAGSLPDRLREAYGFPWGPAERAAFAATKLALVNARRALPKPMRMLPVYRRAMARVAGEPSSRIDHALEGLLFGRVAHV